MSKTSLKLGFSISENHLEHPGMFLTLGCLRTVWGGLGQKSTFFPLFAAKIVYGGWGSWSLCTPLCILMDSDWLLKLSDTVLRKRGGDLGPPPRFSFRAQINSSSPIYLKIEMCIDQPYSKRFPGCFSDSTICDTPLDRFLTIGAKNGAKVGQKPVKYKILIFQRNTHHLTCLRGYDDGVE